MKQFFVFLLIIVLSALPAFVQEYDIRNLKWGMTFEEVQQAEGLDANFYKADELLGIKVEVIFGCGTKGLYSVTYSTQDKIFAGEALRKMTEKYGEPKSDLDYSYILQVKDILKRNPTVVVNAIEKNDFSELNDPKNQTAVSEKGIIRNALSRRSMWEFGNTVALLLDSVEGGALSYWSKNHHYENKKKFTAFFDELKKTAPKIEKKKTDEGEKF